MSTDFYRQFEDRFRTSRDNITQRLRVYEPLLAFIRSQGFESNKALDLGCGRGEWLALLIEAGFEAQGIDLDAGMLEACQELGLPANQGDALAALQAAPDSSLVLVSAFHMVEHIDFELLLKLVEEAQRALVPGGLLLIETPNPENLSVGTSNFYLDPTHSKPIPHALLAFVTEYKAFAATQIVRVNAPFTPHTDDPVLLHDLVFGASPDYAVVAIKSADAKVVEQFKATMPPDMGLALDVLAYRYDDQRAQHFNRLEQTLKQTRHYAQGAHRHVTDAQAVNAQLEQRIAQLELLLQAKPSRTLAGQLKRLPRVLKRFYSGVRQQGVSGVWLPLSNYLNASPKRRNRAMSLLRRWNLPRVSAALFDQTAIAQRLATHVKPAAVLALPPSAQAIDDIVLSELFTHIEE